MKVALALTLAVLSVLQQRSIFADILPPPPAAVPGDSSYIAVVAADLFPAIFNHEELAVSNVVSVPINNVEGCVDEYNNYVLSDIASAGADIRRAVRIQVGVVQLNIDKLNQLELEFVANISHCDELQAFNARFNCYVSEITDLFQRIAAANHGHILVDRPRIFLRLVELARSLNNDFEKLQICLALFQEVTTPEPQASSYSPLSSLSTVSEPPIVVTSSEPQASSDSPLSSLSTVSEPPIVVSSPEPQASSYSPLSSLSAVSEPSIAVSSSERQASSDNSLSSQSIESASNSAASEED